MADCFNCSLSDEDQDTVFRIVELLLLARMTLIIPKDVITSANMLHEDLIRRAGVVAEDIRNSQMLCRISYQLQIHFNPSFCFLCFDNLSIFMSKWRKIKKNHLKRLFLWKMVSIYNNYRLSLFIPSSSSSTTSS